jgi:predicted ArsR family transcriptional regulator
MDLPSAAAGVLAQPTRARLFALLQEGRRAATTADLAGRLGLHANGVRRQLERLHAAGLVERRKATRGRGRPRDEWSVAPGANPGGERPRAYRDLATWLARAIPAAPGRERRIERAGREIGRELAPARWDDPVESFRQVLAALGFQPVLEVRADGSMTCRLCNCPYRDSARESPDVVCTLHKGLTAGLLDALAPGARLSTFEPHEPDLAGCVVEVSGPGLQSHEQREEGDDDKTD